MKTTNWQTKALTLFTAAAVLCVATACISESDNEYPYKLVTPSVPCGPDVPLTQSVELAQLKDPTPLELDWAMRVRQERLRPETERIRAILDEYEERILLQSSLYDGFSLGGGVKSILNEDGELTDKQVIHIAGSEYVDQTSLPPEIRIPDCIDGIEVHFEVVLQPWLLNG